MKSWHTVFLLTITLALGGWIFMHERKLPSTGQILREAETLTDFSPEEVRLIEGVCPAGEFRIERQGRNWLLVEPVKDLADPGKAADLVESLTSLRVLDSVSPGVRSGRGLTEEELGLSPETVIAIRIHLDSGETVRVHAGAGGPFAQTTYVRMPDRRDNGAIYLTGVDLRTALANPAESLRDHRLVRLEPGAVAAWSMRTGSGVVQLERDEYFENKWQLTAPLQTRANDDIAYSILEELVNLEIEQFPELPREMNLVEPDERTAFFELTPKGAEEPIRLALREEEPESPDQPGTMLAWTSHRPHVFRIRNNLVSRLPTSVNQLRYPWLTDADPKLVASITIESPRHPDVELHSDGRTWALLYHGYAVEANKLRVDRFLTALREEPILDFVSDTGSSLRDYGLERPLVKISVATSTMDAARYEAYLEKVREATDAGLEPESVPVPEGEVEKRVFRFGFGEGNLLNVNVEGEPFVYAIDPAFLTSGVETHPLKWRSHQLLSFSMLSLRHLTVREGSEPPIHLEYDYITGQWTGAVGEENIDGLIDRRLADRKARYLGSLEVSEWLTSLSAAYEALQRPSCVVRVGLERSTGEAEPATEDIEVELKLAPAVLSDTGVAYYFGQITGSPDAFLISAESYHRMVAPVLRPPDE